MTSLLGRLLRLFPESVPLEDLFTEAIARLFEANPDLCIGWLEEAGLLSPTPDATIRDRHVRVSSQRSFAFLEHHDIASRPDLVIEVHSSSGEGFTGGGSGADVVMVESKIGSGEGKDQLRRYAEHLNRMAGSDGKTLLYITRAYDPKDRDTILAGLDGNVRFEQLRWHDFYRFLWEAEKDALVEEVILFMKEQGMANDYRFSATDIAALARMSRVVELMEETLDGDVKTELEAFAGNKSRLESMSTFRSLGRYGALAPLHGYDLFCLVSYHLSEPDEYPWLSVDLQAKPQAVERDASVAAMKKIALRQDWEAYDDLDVPTSWAGVSRGKYLVGFLQEEDHVAAVQRFFVESIRQLKEDLSTFREEHPELPWYPT